MAAASRSSILIDRNVPMEMRDGTILRADIFRLDSAEKCPAIMIRTPYNKLISGATDFMNLVDAAFAGFAVVVQDVRGRFASDGKYGEADIATVEGKDGYDSVEWLASQSWCDGNIGMGGLSYQGLLQWHTAINNPPHLKAISPWMNGAGPVREQTMFGGVSLFHLETHWAPMMAMDIADKLEKQGQDVTKMRMMLLKAMFDKEGVSNYLPLKEVPYFKFEGIDQLWKSIFLNIIPGPEMADHARWPYEKIMVPCLFLAGWYDIHSWGPFENWRSMQEKGGTQAARDGQHMIVGPWAHSGQLPGFVGDLSFGPLAGATGALLTDHVLRFFSRYLRGEDKKVAPIRYFIMGRNRWQETATWPPPGVSMQRFFLHSKGRANTAGGDGELSMQTPGSEPADKYVYDPLKPVPTAGGRVVPMAGLVGGPINQSPVETRLDVLCYSTAELVDDTEITGPVVVHLFASTTTRDTDFTAKLVDVYPDGRAYNFADGVIRARYRKGVFQPEYIKPGEVNEYRIVMGNTSWLLRKGHRIRVDISSSNFPAFDRNMNTGNPVGEDVQGIVAQQAIYHETGYQSHIALPVLAATKLNKSRRLL